MWDKVETHTAAQRLIKLYMFLGSEVCERCVDGVMVWLIIGNTTVVGSTPVIGTISNSSQVVVAHWIWPPEQRWYAHLRTLQVLQWKEEISAQNLNANPLNWSLTRTTPLQMQPVLWIPAFPHWRDRWSSCVMSDREKHQKDGALACWQANERTGAGQLSAAGSSV